MLAPGSAAQPAGDHEQHQRYADEDHARPHLRGERQAPEEITDRDAEPPQHLEYADQIQGDRQQRPREPARRSARAPTAQRKPAPDQPEGGQTATEKEPRDLAKGHCLLPSAEPSSPSSHTTADAPAAPARAASRPGIPQCWPGGRPPEPPMALRPS